MYPADQTDFSKNMTADMAKDMSYTAQPGTHPDTATRPITYTNRTHN